MLKTFLRRLKKRFQRFSVARTVRVAPKSSAMRKLVPVPVFYQVNGRKKSERFVITSVTHDRKAHIRSLDRPHVTFRRSLDNLIDSETSVFLPA